MREIRGDGVNHEYNLDFMEEVRTNIIVKYNQTCINIKPSPMGMAFNTEWVLKIIQCHWRQVWLQFVNWLIGSKQKKYENIPDMREVEGGRGLGFDRNVGKKGGGGEI